MSTTTVKQSAVALWLGGALAVMLAAGYIILLSLHVPVPATYVVVLVAAVTHFLGTVVPSATQATTLGRVLELLGTSLAGSQSTSGATTTTTALPATTAPQAPTSTSDGSNTTSGRSTQPAPPEGTAGG